MSGKAIGQGRKDDLLRQVVDELERLGRQFAARPRVDFLPALASQYRILASAVVDNGSNDDLKAAIRRLRLRQGVDSMVASAMSERMHERMRRELAKAGFPHIHNQLRPQYQDYVKAVSDLELGGLAPVLLASAKELGELYTRVSPNLARSGQGGGIRLITHDPASCQYYSEQAQLWASIAGVACLASPLTGGLLCTAATLSASGYGLAAYHYCQ
jgi:hypothetical protein